MGLIRRLFGRSPKPAPLPMPGRPGPDRSSSSPDPTAPMRSGGGDAVFQLGSDDEPAPPRRKVVRAPRILEETEAETGEAAPDGIAIKAQPSADGIECKFMLSTPVLEGRSWWFDGLDAAAGSPLAEQLFAVAPLASILVDESTVTVAHAEAPPDDWRPVAEEIGALLRHHLTSGTPVLSDEIAERIPDEQTLREQIQQVIDFEVNPGVAAHSGHISLTRVRGNSIYIEMGGGCQGCSAADVTLKEGIHRSFRDAVPGVGAIYDDTDHAAGENPYFR